MLNSIENFRNKKIKKIYVATSGGVDSSVALALLKEQGHNVVGVYFKTYKPDGNKDYCKEQGLSAQRVCEHLGVPFKVFDLEEDYKEYVFDYMIHSYSIGITPNPDIMCNKHIKFGVFLQKAQEMGADMIATGHYARTEKLGVQPIRFLRGWTPQFRLLKAVDKNKDQTYFLSQLSAEQLAHALFPIEGLTKPEVRKLAQKYGLHTSTKKDSQGICFIGEQIKVKDFLKNHIQEKEGDVLDIKGKKIGTHFGAFFYTIGERHDFKIGSEHQTPNMPKMFVITKNIEENTLTVGPLEELEQHQSKALVLQIDEVNWISKAPRERKEYQCRIRHRGELYTCTLNSEAKPHCWTILFKEAPYAPSAGQFAVIYDKEECLGGGVIRVV